MSTHRSWIEEARSTPLGEVAAQLLRRSPSRSWGPCPACGCQRRGRSDHRGPIGLRPDGLGWRCHACKEGGDAVTLLALILTGERQPKDWTPVPEWLEDRSVLCRRGAAPPPAPRRSPRPPQGEVLALWDASRPVNAYTGGDPVETQVAVFLALRKFHPFELAPLDLVRVLPHPRHHEWPLWWPATWSGTWRLAVRAFESDGTFSSIHARAVAPGARPKSRWPRAGDGSATGLFFADHSGRTLLQGKPLGSLRCLLVVEGVTDFLRASLVTAGRDDIAVLGGTAGSFAALSKVQMPAGLQVFVGTDWDDAGNRYAQQTARALSPRPVYRLPLERSA